MLYFYAICSVMHIQQLSIALHYDVMMATTSLGDKNFFSFVISTEHCHVWIIVD